MQIRILQWSKKTENIMTNQNEKEQILLNEAPPILKSWPRFYALVSANLVLLLVLFYAFTKVFE